MLDFYYKEKIVIPNEFQRCKDIIEIGTRPHFVYFLLAKTKANEDIVKIGTSTQVNRRVEMIKTRTVHHIDKVLGQVEGDEELESALHLAFYKFQYEKEWFYFKPVKNHIEELLREYGLDPEVRHKEQVDNWLRIKMEKVSL